MLENHPLPHRFSMPGGFDVVDSRWDLVEVV